MRAAAQPCEGGLARRVEQRLPRVTHGTEVDTDRARVKGVGEARGPAVAWAVPSPRTETPPARTRSSALRRCWPPPPALLVAALGLLHPTFLTPDVAERWRLAHLLLLPVFPLVAVSVWAVLRGNRSPLADAARLAAAGYALLYGALDSIAGIGAPQQVIRSAERGDPDPPIGDLYEIGDRLGPPRRLRPRPRRGARRGRPVPALAQPAGARRWRRRRRRLLPVQGATTCSRRTASSPWSASPAGWRCSSWAAAHGSDVGSGR